MPPDCAAVRLVSKPLDVPVMRGVIGIHQLVLRFTKADSPNAVEAIKHGEIKPAFSHGQTQRGLLQLEAMP